MSDRAPACAPPTAVGPQISARLVALGMLHRRLAGQLLAGHGLHVGQERLLFLIADGPRSLGDLAAIMSVNPPTVTKMVNRLEAAGLVATHQSADDGRVRLAALTARGRSALEGATEVWQALEDATTAHLTADDQTTLAALMDRCQAGLRDHVDPAHPAC
jgi:DNA-binding MarR family transcriptional regulator